MIRISSKDIAEIMHSEERLGLKAPTTRAEKTYSYDNGQVEGGSIKAWLLGLLNPGERMRKIRDAAVKNDK